MTGVSLAKNFGCGQVFYSDEQTGLGRWDNPFEGESLSERLDRIDRRQREENEIAEQEKLAGFELAPVIDVFKSEQALATRDRLGAWMARNELEVCAHCRDLSLIVAVILTSSMILTNRSLRRKAPS